jgi:hypothetical protein
MALFFSFYLAMDKFVIGERRDRDRLRVDPVSIRLAVATALTTRLSSFSVVVLSWQHSVTLGCTAPREGAIGLSYRFAEIRTSVSHVSDKLFRGGSVRRTD